MNRTCSFALAFSLLAFPGLRCADAEVRVETAPAGVPLSKEFAVEVDGKQVPAYVARVAAADDSRRWREMDDADQSQALADHASFAPFDMHGPAVVKITCAVDVHALRVLPTAEHIEATTDGKSVRLRMKQPRNLTVEVNGDWVHSLHLFASELENAEPRDGDPNVIYFGPGVHEVREGITVGSGKTLYLARGAILRGIGPGGPVVSLVGENASVRGRGILDGSQCPVHSRNLLFVHGKHLLIDGIILHDSSTWNVPIRQSDDVTVRNLKILGCRANSDGIDICNSRDVTVERCFIRTLDDLVVVKSDKGQGDVKHVVVKNCVLWNQVAHALSVGAELRDPVSDVLFTDCDIIHDTGREWSLRIYHCDSALVKQIRFEKIRIEEARRLFSVWIGKFVWTRDPERGNVRDVSFADIDVVSPKPPVIELTGFDAGHDIEGVVFENVVINGQNLTGEMVKQNLFVKGVEIRPPVR